MQTKYNIKDQFGKINKLKDQSKLRVKLKEAQT
jgi:hypothetical protein